ncbi:MAG: hypothetical protein M0Z41_15810 [Peptococcaceae bacterium]|jgi:hypothetical protein|nr:hypothetical protein [Peptococcaceae bacterium]
MIDRLAMRYAGTIRAIEFDDEPDGENAQAEPWGDTASQAQEPGTPAGESSRYYEPWRGDPEAGYDR